MLSQIFMFLRWGGGLEILKAKILILLLYGILLVKKFSFSIYDTNILFTLVVLMKLL